jgi:hypothetical protein
MERDLHGIARRGRPGKTPAALRRLRLAQRASRRARAGRLIGGVRSRRPQRFPVVPGWAWGQGRRVRRGPVSERVHGSVHLLAGDVRAAADGREVGVPEVLRDAWIRPCSLRLADRRRVQTKEVAYQRRDCRAQLANARPLALGVEVIAVIDLPAQ